MKENELRKVAECKVCHKPFGHTGLPIFFRVSIERLGVNLNTVRRQDGLAALLGGNSALAQVMGTDEEVTVPMMEKTTVTVCEACALEDVNLFVLAGME